MHRTKLPEQPWMHIAADFVGPLPSGHNLLVLIDYYSRFTEVVIMKQITASLTVRALHETFCRFGMPEVLRTDNGPQFISSELQTFCEQFGIRQEKTTPYWPQANGEVERINRSIVKRLKISQETESADWKWDLRMFILMHNSTPHSTTGVAPSSLMFGRILKDKLPGLLLKSSKVLEEISDFDHVNKMKGAEYADKRRNAKPNTIEIGDTVLTKRIQKENKLSTPFSADEFSVIDRRGSEAIIQSKDSSRVIHRHVSHLKKLSTGNGSNVPSDNMLKSRDAADTNDNIEDHNVAESTKQTKPYERPRRVIKLPGYLGDFN
ncbi:uncharacterized protein K02A2.6-like, partial [Armigeres subalbatus]|uniref:uncharacterized protein K02A2.6-like n=1 Tax=Armigeres subalbatus TaxID=124917 RepID=UPI002ED4B5EA